MTNALRRRLPKNLIKLTLVLAFLVNAQNLSPSASIAEKYTYKDTIDLLDVAQFRTYVVKPVLEYLDMYSPAMENLIVGTALQESKLTYLKQLGNGPAIGVYQMEPATFKDHFVNYLTYHQGLKTKLTGLRTGLYDNDAAELAGNLYFATAMAAIHYKRRLKDAILPAATDIAALAKIYKKFYNTPLGKATEEQFIKNYKF